MELRELKKEVDDLPDVEEGLRKFQENWIRPFSKNSPHSSFLKDVRPEARQQLNRRLAEMGRKLDELKAGQRINEKLRHYARNLIELKLTSFNGDQRKSKLITSQLLHDDFYKISRTAKEIDEFGRKTKEVLDEYDEINTFLSSRLSLENSLSFLNQPHRRHLQSLLLTAEKQKRQVLELGRHFLAMTKK